MKLISLNACAAYALDALAVFVKEAAPTTDVFFFQEITSRDGGPADPPGDHRRTDAYQQLMAALPGFRAFYAPVQENLDLPYAVDSVVQFGLAMLVKDGRDLVETGSFFICNGYGTYDGIDYGTLGYNAQYAVLRTASGGLVTACGLHGVSLPEHKNDTPARLAQSRKILDFPRGRPGETIVMGDFNLNPDTESIGMIERAGYRNLISEFGITTTRGAYVKKLHPEYEHGPWGFQEFADYAFVSPGVTVEKFEVPDLPVSDHLPMILTVT